MPWPLCRPAVTISSSDAPQGVLSRSPSQQTRSSRPGVQWAPEKLTWPTWTVISLRSRPDGVGSKQRARRDERGQYGGSSSHRLSELIGALREVPIVVLVLPRRLWRLYGLSARVGMAGSPSRRRRRRRRQEEQAAELERQSSRKLSMVISSQEEAAACCRLGWGENLRVSDRAAGCSAGSPHSNAALEHPRTAFWG